MSKNRVYSYNPRLKLLARILRQNSTLAEVLLWKNIKGNALGYEFHRQVPIDEFIVDFYCHELLLAIEIDGYTHDYNFAKDESRQRKLESLGIIVVRIAESDVKKAMIDVIRVLQSVISEIEINEKSTKKREGHPPNPLQRGNEIPLHPLERGRPLHFVQGRPSKGACTLKWEFLF